MKPQSFEVKRTSLQKAFVRKLEQNPTLREQQVKLAWSNWGFGIESLDRSAARLARHGIEWIELHGNRYGPDLGYRVPEVREVLTRHGLKVAGVCGMFGVENDLSSPSGVTRQRAVDYLRRQIDLCRELGGHYLLVVPGAVGRPDPYDESEFFRSAETLRIVADGFVEAGIKAAIEPIRSAEVSLVHTIADARKYLEVVDHLGIQHINGDVFHMQTEEPNIAEAILEAGDQLVNLHLADSHRGALGHGSMDIDAILMALYVLDFPAGDRFATAEPLGPGGAPYPAMFGQPSEAFLDQLVADTAKNWRTREQEIKTHT